MDGLLDRPGFPKQVAAPQSPVELRSTAGPGKTYRFKTNINCNGCANAVKAHLAKSEGIISWTVDTKDPDRILKLEAAGISPEELILLLQTAGFKAALITG